MKKAIYILGASGLGRETYCLLRDLPQYSVAAFVGHDGSEQTQLEVNGTVVEVIKESEFEQVCRSGRDVCAVIGIGRPHLRKKIAERFGDLCDFPNIVHPSVEFTGKVTLGRGNLITHHCFFTENITIGDFNFFNTFNNVGHDASFGNYNVVLPSCNISGFVSINDTNLIGAKVFILEHKTVGSHTTIGAGSVVLRNVPDHCTMVGIPAKKIDFN